MCNHDKQLFANEVTATNAAIKAMQTQVKFTQALPEFTLTRGLMKYSIDYKSVDRKNPITDAERLDNATNLGALEREVAAKLAEAEANMEATANLKRALLK